MNEHELLRAQELAQAGQAANELFWTLMIGAILIFAFWSLVRMRLNALQRQHYRDMALRAEVERNEHEAARYWDDFCRRNELPESTRRVLLGRQEGGAGHEALGAGEERSMLNVQR